MTQTSYVNKSIIDTKNELQKNTLLKLVQI